MMPARISRFPIWPRRACLAGSAVLMPKMAAAHEPGVGFSVLEAAVWVWLLFVATMPGLLGRNWFDYFLRAFLILLAMSWLALKVAVAVQEKKQAAAGERAPDAESIAPEAPEGGP